jgi:hypothetical protein
MPKASGGRTGGKTVGNGGGFPFFWSKFEPVVGLSPVVVESFFCLGFFSFLSFSGVDFFAASVKELPP